MISHSGPGDLGTRDDDRSIVGGEGGPGPVCLDTKSRKRPEQAQQVSDCQQSWAWGVIRHEVSPVLRSGYIAIN